MDGFILFYFTERLFNNKNDKIEAKEHPETDYGN